MTMLTRMTMLAMGATALVVLPGCDSDPVEIDDEYVGDLDFRCDVLGGCGGGGSGSGTNDKGNTSFLGELLGESLYPLNNLPVTGGSFGGVEIESIYATQCMTRTGAFVEGESEPNPTVSISPKGLLLNKTFTQVADPEETCVVYGALWVDTYWTISYGDAALSFETELWIKSMDLSKGGNGSPLYELWVDSGSVPDPRTGWSSLCGYAWEEPGVDFEAYFMPGLVLDQSGAFTSDPSTAFIGCVSGSIGKAWLWGYKSHLQAIGSAGHEVAHHAIRAEYCGDHVTYTQTGTPIWFQSVFTDEGPDPNAPDDSDWKLEAVWSSDPDAPAICVGKTRLPEHQPDAQDPFVCDDLTEIPICNEGHLTAPNAVLASWSHHPLVY